MFEDMLTPSAASNEPTILRKPRKVIPIHTSDRGLYKTCRRRWIWGSHLNRGLEPNQKASPLWYGEAFHYALKEYHGYRKFSDIRDAFAAFVEMSYIHYPKHLPHDAPDLVRLGGAMLTHYMDWLERRDPLLTYLHDDVPQVEVTFEIDLTPYIREDIVEFLSEGGVYEVQIVYRGTFDRISIDENGNLWIVEYKTAKVVSTAHLLWDPQVSAYCFAAQCLYDRPVMGVIYQQHRKDAPKPARILQKGDVSVAKNQSTTHKLYRQALIEVYGPKEEGRWTNEHIEVLNMFATRETVDKDDFVVRTKVERNMQQLITEGRQIIAEVEEMLDPRTVMYPHKGRHCSMCQFGSPCVSLDDGSDWEYELNDRDIYKQRIKASSEWELLASDMLGNVLYSSQARILHDAAGRPSAS